jgi:hypothetical protein
VAGLTVADLTERRVEATRTSEPDERHAEKRLCIENWQVNLVAASMSALGHCRT